MTERSPSSSSPASRACLRYGWAALVMFLLLGLVLEFLHLVKLPLYLDTTLRRELWTLAHAHGTLLALVNLAFAVTAERCLDSEPARARASWLLRVGAALVPAGFFLGGIGNAEADPSLFIALVPIGAVLVMAGAAIAARGAFAGAPSERAADAGSAGDSGSGASSGGKRGGKSSRSGKRR